MEGSVAQAARRSFQSLDTEPLVIEGVVKWFDPVKRFGFVVPDNGLPDVLLHADCLRQDGYDIAYEGARVKLQVLERHKGMHAVRVLSMDESKAIGPAMSPVRGRRRGPVISEGKFVRAWVKKYFYPRGYGFFTCGQGTPDIFFHKETMRRCGIGALVEGQGALVRYGRGRSGFEVIEIKLT